MSASTQTMSRMFDLVTETWNPVTGCFHDCPYCWARKLAETKLKHVNRYAKGFKPRLNEKEFKRRFKPDSLVFVSDMGDLFGYWVPKEWIQQVLDYIKEFPETTFLLLTKNPNRYLDFIIPENCIQGATIETNRHKFLFSLAPTPEERAEAMEMIKLNLNNSKTMVSIEPIMDFDFSILVKWIRDIEPEFVYIGYDNHGNNLEEPSIKKVEKLINELQKFTVVRIKRSVEKKLPHKQ